MRIIGGKNKGRKLLLPDATYTRPTTDRIRESIFNIIVHHAEINLQGAYVLDGFAGSGAMGLEALSRGAAKVILVEQQPPVFKILKQNVSAIDQGGQIELIQGDLRKIKVARRPMDLVFLDPPYGQGLEFQAISYLKSQGWMNEDTIIIYETDQKTCIDQLQDMVDVMDERSYGGIVIRFMRIRTN